MTIPHIDLSDNVPQPHQSYKVMAIYKFADLPDAETIRSQLTKLCCDEGIKGTLILAHEGINGTVAGTDVAIARLTAFLFKSDVLGGRLAGAEVKYSTARNMPFLRMKVRIKPEIVTLRAPQANPARQVGTYVEPEDWNTLIERSDIVLVDTRNDYEVCLGSFQRALNPATQNFTAFKDYVATYLDPQRDKKVAMFCTGGIRCEKASSYLLSQGFEEVFHLKGGILKYLEVVPQEQSRFAGECFVFDERVSVRHGLVEGNATLCRACRHPLTGTDREHQDYVSGISCPYCAGDTHKHTAAAERQRQMELARKRGSAHMGDDAVLEAVRRKTHKQVAAKASRLRSRVQSTST